MRGIAPIAEAPSRTVSKLGVSIETETLFRESGCISPSVFDIKTVGIKGEADEVQEAVMLEESANVTRNEVVRRTENRHGPSKGCDEMPPRQPVQRKWHLGRVQAFLNWETRRQVMVREKEDRLPVGGGRRDGYSKGVESNSIPVACELVPVRLPNLNARIFTAGCLVRTRAGFVFRDIPLRLATAKFSFHHDKVGLGIGMECQEYVRCPVALSGRPESDVNLGRQFAIEKRLRGTETAGAAYPGQKAALERKVAQEAEHGRGQAIFSGRKLVADLGLNHNQITIHKPEIFGEA